MTYPVQFDSPDLAQQTAAETQGAEYSRDLVEAITEISQNAEPYDRALEYDSINLWEANMLSREGRTLRQSDIDFEPNFCGVVIDTVSNRLEMTSVTATSGSVQNDSASTAATAALNSLWDDNKLQLYYRVWDRLACRDGDAYIVVWPQEYVDGTDADADTDVDFAEDGPRSAGAGTPVAKTVNVTYVDPRMGRMFYDPENPRKKRFFAQLWEVTLDGEKKARLRCNLYYSDRIEKYISKPGTRNAKPGDFMRYFDPDHDGDNDYPGAGGDADDDPELPDDRQWPMPNPYGVIPAFHLRTDLQYGKPIHRNAFALQDALARLIEMLMVTVEFSGYPQRYALQEADSLGNQSIREDPLASDSPATWDHDFTETALSTVSVVAGAISNETGTNYEANPGGMQIFKNFSEVGQFTTADPNAFLEPWREFGKAISSTTSTPLYKFQGLGGQIPSGEALKIIEAPLLTTVRFLFDLLGDTWREALEFALLCVGYPDARVTITWANPATTDLMDVWQLVKAKIELGVPRDEAFMAAGIPEQQAREWAKNFATAEALAEQEQGRAQMFLAQAEQQRWAAVQAKMQAGVPQPTALVEAGYSEQEVTTWATDRAETLALTTRVQLLGQVTTAIQQLGTAVGLGVMSPPQAEQIIISVLGDILPAADVPAPDPTLTGGGAGDQGGYDDGSYDQQDDSGQYAEDQQTQDDLQQSDYVGAGPGE